MADQHHLRRLRKDVYTWNGWRKGHPDIMVDLSGAHLSERTYSVRTSTERTSAVRTSTERTSVWRA